MSCNRNLIKNPSASDIIKTGDTMKKKILILLMILMSLMPTKTFAKGEVQGLKSPQDLYINKQRTDLKGYNIKDHNYYRLRDLASLLKIHDLNFSLWGDDKRIIINLDETYEDTKNQGIILKEDKAQALEKEITLKLIKNGKAESYQFKAYNIDGYNYFKLRDMGKYLNYDVDYDEKNNLAMIFTNVITVKVPSNKKIVLGNERLLEEYSHLIDGKNLGLITNQTGLDSKNVRTVDKLYNYDKAKLLAIYSPEHGLDGKHQAGKYVESYIDEDLNLPVYSLYGKTRKPSPEMLASIDVLIFDIQDIGSRTYTYISTLNYAMKAAKEAGIPLLVLDRPNPVGGQIVEGFVLKDAYETFVGVDELPMAHGMTVGELAKFFNRKISADLKVIEMQGYKRSMIWKDTGLPFSQTSPNIPNLESAFNYMAAGIGDGTGLGQGDKFTWVGAKGLDSKDFARILNSYDLPGISFVGEDKKDKGGVRLVISDYHTYNPQKTGTYILATANLLGAINIPEEVDGKVPMFEKIHGGKMMGQALKNKLRPQEIVDLYQKDLRDFMVEREIYLIYK